MYDAFGSVAKMGRWCSA